MFKGSKAPVEVEAVGDGYGEFASFETYIQERFDGASRRGSEIQALGEVPRWPVMETAAIETIRETSFIASTPGRTHGFPLTPVLTTASSSSVSTSESKRPPTEPPSSPVMSTTSTDSQESLGSKKRSIWKAFTKSTSWPSPPPITPPNDSIPTAAGRAGANLNDIRSDRFFVAVDERSERVAFWSDKGVVICSSAASLAALNSTNITGLAKDRPLLAMSASRIAAVVGTGEIQVINAEQPHRTRKLRGAQRVVHCIAVTADGSYVVCGSDRGTLLCYDIADGDWLAAAARGPTEICLAQHNTEDIATIHPIRGGTVLAAVRVKEQGPEGSEGHFRVFVYEIDVSRGETNLLWNHYGYPSTGWGADGYATNIELCFSEASKTLYLHAGCQNSHPQLVNLRNPEKPSAVYLRRSRGDTMPVKMAAFTRSGDILILACADGGLYSCLVRSAFPTNRGSRRGGRMDVRCFVEELRKPGAAYEDGAQAVGIWAVRGDAGVAVVWAETAKKKSPPVACYREVPL